MPQKTADEKWGLFMYQKKKIAVVVPAYNEEKLIGQTLLNIPSYVDKIIVVDDASRDDTVTIVQSTQSELEDRLEIIKNRQNIGVGGAIKTGYGKSLELDMDIIAVMAGDGQMDPNDLPSLLDPIAEGKADYAKGNRLEHPEKLKMPGIRRWGNSILTLLTKIASGYWDVIDPQNGYTAISKKALEAIELDHIYNGYGCPNDFLIELNIRNMRVMDVEMPPKYGEEKSNIKLGRYSLRLSWLLVKGFFRRLNLKYGGLHFHPLWLFYYGGIFLFISGFLHASYLAYQSFFHEIAVSSGTVVIPILFLIMGYISILFAFFFDMNENADLFVK